MKPNIIKTNKINADETWIDYDIFIPSLHSHRRHSSKSFPAVAADLFPHI